MNVRRIIILLVAVVSVSIALFCLHRSNRLSLEDNRKNTSMNRPLGKTHLVEANKKVVDESGDEKDDVNGKQKEPRWWWKSHDDVPVLQVLSSHPDGIITDHPGVKLNLKEAIDRLYEFFMKNGPETGMEKIEISKEDFMKELYFDAADDVAGGIYKMGFRKYRVGISAIDGTIEIINYPAWVTIERSEAKTIEEAKEVLKRIAGITLEEGKEIALRFLYTNHPFFKEEEFDLIKCDVKIYNSGSKSCYYEYIWRRKKKLPGYYKVYPTEVTFDLDPKSGLIESYYGGIFDYKAKFPPNITKEEALKIAKARLLPPFPHRLPEKWFSHFRDVLSKPDVDEIVVGDSLYYEVTFWYPTEIIMDRYDGDKDEIVCEVRAVGRRMICIDAYTGEVLSDTGGKGECWFVGRETGDEENDKRRYKEWLEKVLRWLRENGYSVPPPYR